MREQPHGNTRGLLPLLITMRCMMNIATVLSTLTLEEKCALLSGKGEWESWDLPRAGVPSLVCSDGPHGIRRQAGAGDHLGLNPSLPATCFPTAATIAGSWDPDLGEEIGQALGEEAAAQGVNIVLGPGLNIKRSPLCGRNFEYFSEDPYLAGKLAAGYIRGIQSQGVYACPKHFAVNSQELRRMAMNAVVDERTLREIYLTGFEIAIREGGPGALMTSYNQVNGTYANENPHLLQDILRGEWGYDGLVITDWGGSNDHVEGVRNGSDLEMPNPGMDSARQLVEAVRSGRLPESAVDACAERMIRAALALHERKEKPAAFDKAAHHALARRAAAESAVLLKNEDDILPLKPGIRVAVIGDFAFTPRYQGAGSSMVNATQVDTLAGLLADSSLNWVGAVRGYSRDGVPDAALAKAALDLAASVDVVIYCFGLDELSESEGIDRSHMRIPGNQIELLEALSRVNPHIVGVLSAGAAVEMPWLSCCQALLHSYLYGQAGAGAMLELLTGAINPSGRLAESYPLRYEDTPAYRYFPSQQRSAEYREGPYIGYRYYATTGTPVLFPFGYGLSYTTFAYRDLTVEQDGVTLTVENTGPRDGAEVVQLYIGKPDARVFRPVRELKGFQKVFLKAGESQRVRIPFDDKTFRYWNVATNGWETEGGIYQVEVGASSLDIRLTATTERAATTHRLPYEDAGLPHYGSGDIRQVPDEEFSALLGTPIPDGRWSGELTANDAICQLYYAKSRLARLVYRILTRKKQRSEAAGKPDLNILFIYNMPFRAIAKMTGGTVSSEMVDGLVLMVNGHFWKGLTRTVRGFFRNRAKNEAYVAMLSADWKEE